ncbi:glycosyltransferase [uncultured Pigmentiphaga sp.]|jgi:Glycosyltransferase|uniref:glycosyltransferase n=1 Tax=uncultured Pigmentiphaga sp. TaxID=340361 RepID=UPI0026290202|nr:glycosyltransferase [uncultured Pigmentiphaga sp.]
MKVLHVYRTYFPDPPGGLQEAIRQICISTQAHGVENTVFTLSPKPWPRVVDRPEAKVVRCRSWVAPASCDLGALDAVQSFRQLAVQADVIHYLFPWPYADVLRLFIPKKPSVLTYISDIVRQQWLGMVYRPLMWHTLRSMDAIVSNAPAYAAGSPVLSDPSIRTRVRQIPLGIDESSYAVAPDEAVFAKLGIESAEPFVLFIGVLRYYKGLHVLLDGCRHVAGRVVVAGTGPEASALQSQASLLGLKNVVFAGQVTDSEKMALLKACRCLVLPSHLRSEAYGMVLVEASMYSKPMVSCEIGTGTSFVNLHGETGFVVPPESPEALAHAMNALLGDEAQAEKFGRAARRRYEALFSGPAMGRAYAQLYQDVLNKCP